jgi:hypothetical protein
LRPQLATLKTEKEAVTEAQLRDANRTTTATEYFGFLSVAGNVGQ